MILQEPDLQMGLSDLQKVLIGVSLAAKVLACVLYKKQHELSPAVFTLHFTPPLS